MFPIAKTVGMCVALCAMPWKAPAAASASMQVSLTIRESCLIQATYRATRPVVSCLHDAPYLARRVRQPSSLQGDALAVDGPVDGIWLVMF